MLLFVPAGVDDEDEVVSEEEGSFKDAEEEPQNRSEDSDEILDGGGTDVAGLASNDTSVSFWPFFIKILNLSDRLFELTTLSITSHQVLRYFLDAVR